MGLFEDQIQQFAYGRIVPHRQPGVQHLRKIQQGIVSTRAERMRDLGLRRQLEQRLRRLPAAAPRPLLQRLLRLAPNPARGGVYDSVQADGIGRVVDHTQVGDQILDLPPTVKASRPDQLVRHPPPQESFL